MILISINFDYLIVSGIFAILYLIWSLVIKPKRNKKQIYLSLNKIANEYNYKLTKVENEKYDYILEKENKKLIIKLAFVPNVSAITINSKNTWNLSYGGSGQVGKSYLNQRYMNELKPFLNMKSDEGILKVVLIYKSTHKVQRYLNESEIELIKYTNLIYDYKVITFEDLYNHIEDL